MISVDTIISDIHNLSNLEHICRLCGKSQQPFVPIFDETHRFNYYRVIHLHFREELQVSKSDVLPLKLCSVCLKTMMSWHEFYLNCLKVKKKFLQLVDKFSLNEEAEKKTLTVGNDVEVIEVSVDGDNYDFFNENASDFDISNINIKESTSFVDANDFSRFDDLNDTSNSDTENKTSGKSTNHSESMTMKSEEPKKMNCIKSQSLTLGKRSTTFKSYDEEASSAAKRTKSNTKARGGDDCGNNIDNLKHSNSKKKTNAVSKRGKSPDVKNSLTNEFGGITKHLKLPDKSTEESASITKSRTDVPETRITSVKIVVDNDSDIEIVEDELKREIENELEDRDGDYDDYYDDDDDEIYHLECDIEIQSPSSPSNNAQHEEVNTSVLTTIANQGNETVANKGKKKIIRQPKMCDICGKVVSAKLFKEHMIMHNDPESMTCSCCRKLFSTLSTLKKHFIWTHTSLRPFMCDLCGNTFKRNDHLKLHRDHFHANENSGGTAVKCGMCGASVQTMVSLQSHMKRVHGQTKVVSYDKDLNHKILADKSYECGICGLNFKQFSYLRIHIKFVHEKGLPWHINQGANGPYKCNPCNSTYATLQSLREHNRRRHDGAPVEKFHKECTHCGMLYRNRLHYSKHLAKISGRPTCYVCWNDFDNAEDLKVHINSDHLDELPFGCELCGVRFVYLTELRNHMYTHSKIKQFKCDQCSQSFVRKDFLKSHKRRHEGIRNHTCEECSKSFVEFCDLRKHMQIHRKNRLFVATKEEKK